MIINWIMKKPQILETGFEAILGDRILALTSLSSFF